MMASLDRTSELIDRLQQSPKGSDDLLFDVTVLLDNGADPSVLVPGKQGTPVTTAFAAIDTGIAIDVAAHLLRTGANLLTEEQSRHFAGSQLRKEGAYILDRVSTATRETDETYTLNSLSAMYEESHENLRRDVNDVLLHLRSNRPDAFRHVLEHPHLPFLVSRLGGDVNRNQEVFDHAFDDGGERIPDRFIENMLDSEDGEHAFLWVIDHRLPEICAFGARQPDTLIDGMLNWHGSVFVEGLRSGVLSREAVDIAHRRIANEPDRYDTLSWRDARRELTSHRVAPRVISRPSKHSGPL